MKTGLVPTNCTLYDEASLVISFSASAPRVSASWSSAASRSISNGHSYGYDSTSMRSWRSTAAHSPGSVDVVDALGADDVAARDGVAEERGCGERLVVGEGLLRQAPPHTVVVDEHARHRVAERPGISSAHHSPRTVIRQGPGRTLGVRRLAVRRRRLRRRARRRLERAGPVPPRPGCGASSRTRRGTGAVHLEEHAETGGATGERSHDHAAGAGIEVTEHRPDCSAAFTVRSLAGHRVFTLTTPVLSASWAGAASDADRTGVVGDHGSWRRPLT